MVVYLPPPDAETDVDPVAAGAWATLPDSGLAGRSDASVVWTRKAMVVWGGEADTGVRGDGASYDLAGDTWTPLPPSPIAPRRSHTAIWTGTKMVVYGGLGIAGECSQICALGDGAAYDSISNTWRAITPAPISPRSGHSAVWLQNRMVVWGGTAEGGVALADGASYDPAADTWTSLPPSPLSPRVGHRVVASTHRMLVWGGSASAADGGKSVADGAVYTPATNSWVPMAAAPASLPGRDTFASVWTGKQLLVWGGFRRGDGCAPCAQGDGAVYDLDSDAWTPMAPAPVSGRGDAEAVWSGRDMLLWGGSDGGVQADGALYNPTNDSWARVVPGSLAPRRQHAMVWTGQQLLIWGGEGGSGKLADGAVLTLNSS